MSYQIWTKQVYEMEKKSNHFILKYRKTNAVYNEIYNCKKSHVNVDILILAQYFNNKIILIENILYFSIKHAY